MKALIAATLVALSVSAAAAAPNSGSDFATRFFEKQMLSGN